MSTEMMQREAPFAIPDGSTAQSSRGSGAVNLGMGERYLRPLLERIQAGQLDSTFVITHRLPLDEAPHGYEIFKHKRDGCVKVVLDPWQQAA